MCFYEPFSEELGRMSLDFLRHHGPKTWNSKHAAMAPYYLEYEPLMSSSGRGIQGFDPTFTFQEYFRTEGDLSRQRAYLDSLLDLAQRAKKVPVLGFCKSVGRLAWIKEAFPDALHVVTLRDPVQQWISGYQFYLETKNPYFLQYFQFIMASPANNSYIQELLSRNLHVPGASQIHLAQSYEMFLHIYGCTFTSAVAMADLVIDIDRMTNSTSYRGYVTDQVRMMSGLPVDFDDCHISHHPLRGVPVDFLSINERVTTELRGKTAVSSDVRGSYEFHPASVLEKMEACVH